MVLELIFCTFDYYVNWGRQGKVTHDNGRHIRQMSLFCQHCFLGGPLVSYLKYNLSVCFLLLLYSTYF